MATLSRAESKHMYSWWWNSHISPKNSKWLQENLTDMDSKVKNMIKLIEVDEDSFARRAEMYYKKRPELMKLVEEFYRAYRALAERYDHATGVIRHAHRTMAEVFPDQVQGMGSDENDSEPRTPEMSMSARPSCDPDELPKGAIGLSRSDKVIRNRDAAFTHESETTAGQNGESSISDNQGETRARRSLNFHNSEKNDSMAESKRMGRYETDVMALKEALSKLQAEKEAGLLQFQQSLQKLSDLEAELKGAQDVAKSLFERAVNAEAQVQTLKDSLAKLEGEREANLHQYQKCVEKISGLEANITHAQEDVERQDKQAYQSEQEAQVLREELSHLRSEKESSLAKYMEALEKIANLGNQLLLAEDKAEATNKRADKAEKEVEALTKDVESLSKDNKALAIKYEQCLSKIASLEAEIALVKEEAERLKHERDEGAAKLKGAEEQCHVLERSNMSMKSELDTLSHKVGMQNEELSEKQRELGRLWTCVQEERLRFVEVETAFRTLQGLHSQNQEELRSVASELQKRVQLLKEMEIQNQSLQDEVQKVRDENTGLHLSSAASIKNLQDEISNLQTGKCQLEGELEHRLDQRNALQQEIYCLKEELKDLNKKHHAVMEQVESVGFLPECIGSSIRDLREENSSLKESCQSSEAEISALLEKLTSMEKLVENNALLEKSLSELGSELENARAKVKALEESCQLLVDEKSSAMAEKATLISQLEITTENLEKLSERNTLLENSLFDANAELEALRASSKKLEESCLLLGDEKSVLVSEKQALEMKLESAQKQLEDLGTRHKELEQNYSGMKDKRESALGLLEELRTSLATEKQERSTASQLTGQQIAKMENQIRSLEKVGKKTREELEGELDNAMNAQLEIFILQNSLHDMREKNSALLLKCEKILETSKLSEKLISELEYENIEQQDEVNFLSDQIKRLRMGMVQLLKALEVDLDCAYDEKHLDDDQLLLHRILVKLDDTKSSLYKAWDENQKLVIEKSVLITLLGQLKQEVADLKTLIITVQQEFRIGNDQLSSLQSDMKRLLQSNEELILSVREGNHKENLLAAEVESLRAKVLQMQGVCKDLETENGKVQEEKKSLTKQVLYLDEEKNKLELENSNLVMEAVSLGNLSVILQSTTEQSWDVIDQLNNDIDRLWSHNWALEEKVKIVENKLDEAQMEKSSLERSLKTCEHELEEVTVVNSQLKEELSLKEMELLQVESVKDDEQKQKLDLSEKYNQQLKERELIQQSMNDLDAELIRTKEEQEDARQRVEMMGFELQKRKDEAEVWETAAGTFFTELQATAVREALVNEKLSELSREYVSLQDENSRVQAQLAGYIPALACITDSVASLENHATPTQFEHIDGQEKKGAGSGQGPNEDDDFTANGFSELKNVAMRIKAIETSVIEMKKLSDEQNSQTSSKLDVATREIETLRSQQLSRSHRGGSSRSSRRYSPEIIEAESSQNGHINHQQKQAPRTNSFESSGGGDMMMMKDIVLDQVSSATSSHGRNMKGDNDRDDRNLELWETMDQGGGSINLRVGRISHYKAASTPSQNQQLFDAVKEHHKNRPPSSESLGGKEIISVDKMDISSRFPEFLEPETKKKVLERLASDIQKLTNLQITVQDLKEKVVTTENNSNMKGNKGGAVEYVGVKEQLGEAQSTISKLLETNEKLVKKVESSSLHMSSYSDVSSTSSMMDTTSEIGASSRRRGRVSEQARRCSEKIGRLQLEVQKIQFLLLKLDGAGSNRTSTGRGGGTRVGERNTRVVLRDYLYGGPRTPRRRMKSRFCGCVRPPTSGGD